MRDLHNCKQYTHWAYWTYIHQSVFLPLHSSLFLKVHSHGMGTPSHPAEWGRAECTQLHLGDVHILTPIHHLMITPSRLTQWSWSLVSRTHTIRTTYWGCVFSDNRAIDLNWHSLESNWLSNSVSSLPSPGMCGTAIDMQPPLLQCVLTVHQGLTDSVVASLHYPHSQAILMSSFDC